MLIGLMNISKILFLEMIGAQSNQVNSDVPAFLRTVLWTSETNIERAMTQDNTPRNASIARRNQRHKMTAISR
jgi:hypothetical protein